MLCVAGPCAAFEDRLDVPAAASALAPKKQLNAIVLAGTRLVAVGQRGHILLSDDGGVHWLQAKVPVSVDLTAVCFPTPTQGWAVGHDGVILVSKDSGATWTRQFDARMAMASVTAYYAAASQAQLGVDAQAWQRQRADAEHFVSDGADKSFLDVWFDDAQTGYAVGLFNQIFHTSDGGLHWSPWMHSTDNPQALNFYAVRRIGGQLFLGGEQGMVLRFDPAARRFRRLAVDYKGTLFGLAGTGKVLLAFGLRGTLLRSQDGGERWEAVPSNVVGALVGATATADGRIVVVSQRGEMLVSSDGRQFERLVTPASLPTSALVATGANELVVVGAGGVRTERLKR
ncbi:hypothetical protein CD932_24085 [Janthinobacterium sp. PC23-8]|nr:hypothetical protein CD932_24085 [Janthinobacterium sp. PC23-8]